MKIVKKVIKILLLLSICFTLLLAIGYAIITNWWRHAFTEKQMKEHAQTVSNTPSLPQKLYNIYDKIYPEDRHLGNIKELLNIGKEIPMKVSNYRLVYQFLFTLEEQKQIQTKMKRHPHYFFGLGLQKYCEPEKAFDYVFRKRHKYFGSYGFSAEGHNKLFSKPLDNLTEDEIIEIILLMESPTYYNKYQFPERFENKMSQYKELLE